MSLKDLTRHLNLYDIRKGLMEPNRAWRVIKGHLSGDGGHSPEEDEEIRRTAVGKFLDIPEGKVAKYEQELQHDPLRSWIERGIEEFEDRPYTGGGLHTNGEILYSVARTIEPQSALEIGVANGFSTALLLGAFEANDTPNAAIRGIDRPLFEEHIRRVRGRRGLTGGLIPPTKEVGWVAPRWVRKKYCYQLHVGDFTEVLPGVISEQDNLDLMAYDASKDEEDIEFAMRTCLEVLNEGGVLFLDDIGQDGSFHSVTREYPGEGILVGNCGLFRKKRGTN